MTSIKTEVNFNVNHHGDSANYLEVGISNLIWKGETVRFCTASATCPVVTFLEELAESDLKKIFTIFRMIDVRGGNFRHAVKFTNLGRSFHGKTILEIKSHQIRIACFWGKERTLHLAHAFLKKDNKWPKGELGILKSVCKDFVDKEKETEKRSNHRR